jgi:pimeloyl-ACP methyl ester carboxylesterase
VAWEEIRFGASPEECVGRLYRPDSPTGTLACVVLGSGFSCVRDQGLDAVAERLADAGYAALAFDYRHWGESEGEPRQLSDAGRHRVDWRAAISRAAAEDDIDSGKIVLWAYSLGTGHAQALAADGVDVAALICVAPLLSGRGSLLHIGGTRHVIRLTGAGLRDAARAVRRAEPYRIPAVGEPGSLAVINSPETVDGFAAITPPGSSWRNEVCARVALIPPYNLVRKVGRIGCPVLYCVFREDDVNPPDLARRAARRAPRGELREYPGGHYAAFSEGVFESLLADQVEFLDRHIGTAGRAAAG